MSDLNCTACKGWQKCLLSNPVILDVEDFYSYNEVIFCPFQIIFLLTHRELLERGEWPPEYKESEGSRKITPEGRFVKPAIVLAELMTRLEKTGRCGELLITQIEDGRSFHTLSDGARQALMYCKGYKRKAIPFNRWLRDVYFRQKTRPIEEIG